MPEAVIPPITGGLLSPAKPVRTGPEHAPTPEAEASPSGSRRAFFAVGATVAALAGSIAADAGQPHGAADPDAELFAACAAWRRAHFRFNRLSGDNNFDPGTPEELAAAGHAEFDLILRICAWPADSWRAVQAKAAVLSHYVAKPEPGDCIVDYLTASLVGDVLAVREVRA